MYNISTTSCNNTTAPIPQLPAQFQFKCEQKQQIDNAIRLCFVSFLVCFVFVVEVGLSGFSCSTLCFFFFVFYPFRSLFLLFLFLFILIILMSICDAESRWKFMYGSFY